MNARTILSPANKRPKSFSGAEITKIISALRSKLTPDLLKEEYKLDQRHPMFGHCFVATEALWNLTDRTMDVYCGKDDEGIIHWWLRDSLGHIWDPTADQYTDLGKEPPYLQGKKNGFMQTYDGPSERAKELIERIQNS